MKLIRQRILDLVIYGTCNFIYLYVYKCSFQRCNMYHNAYNLRAKPPPIEKFWLPTLPSIERVSAASFSGGKAADA